MSSTLCYKSPPQRQELALQTSFKLDVYKKGYRRSMSIDLLKKISLVSVLVLSLSACSSVDNALDTKVGVNYHNNTEVNILKSPEGLVAPEYDMTFALPEGDVNSNNQSVVDIRPPDITQ